MNEEKILALLEKMNQRMEKMEGHLDLVESQSQRTAVLMESEVNRKLDLLYEGHNTIMDRLDKLATKNRVDELESDVALLKDSFKLMRLEIEALKKAQ